jgi:phosphatidylserine decarboxylase
VYAGDSFLVPGATVATLLMLGFLHARRLYDDKKVIGYMLIPNS